MPDVIKVNSINPSRKTIEIVTRAVREGLTFVYPTDTLYGLGTNALNSQSVSKIFRIKERPVDKPLPIAVLNSAMAEKYAIIEKEAKMLMEKFWPGALTIIVEKKKIIPRIVTGGKEKIGLRAPDHKVPIKIIETTGLPLIATSANKHGRQSSLTAQEAINQLGQKVDLVIDGGKIERGKPSTIIDVANTRPILLREGVIRREEIEAVLKKKILTATIKKVE